MKHFKFSKLFTILIALEIIFSIYGCDKISQGLQRNKFEFLYRMNNDVTLLREYTSGINKAEDLKFFESKLNNLFASVNKMETVKNYGGSDALKEQFLNLIDSDLEAVKILKDKNLPADDIIKDEYEVQIMKDNVNSFIEHLNAEIVKVGKE
ncbi:MAG TPA: hypothetical protein PK294_02035 [Ignavibacteria bacterium]|nr:hypothetical protein [Ignavibacteria bacterium]